MLDRNGVEITVGARAEVLSDCPLRGWKGKIRWVSESIDGVRLAGRQPNGWFWSSWCRPSDVAVLPAAADGGAK